MLLQKIARKFYTKALPQLSKSRREEAHHILSHMRVELREMSIFLSKEKILPEKGEVRALIAQMDALYDCVSGVKKKPAPVFKD